MQATSICLTGLVLLAATLSGTFADADVPISDTIYQFSAKSVDGDVVSLEKYKGKVVLIVNVASKCSTTEKDYKQLNETYHKYHDRGLEIALFPLKSRQEPGTDAEIKESILAYGFTPDIYAKIAVNGDKPIPLYKFLKEKQGGVIGDAIQWNFTTFLVDRHGRPVKRYETDPVDIHPDIDDLL